MSSPGAGDHDGAPATTIIIIFLNAAPFLAEAIGSVRAQTRPDWELLLVDDGSTDGGSAIAEGAAARDPTRVRVLAHPGHANRGTSASRELGLREARGRTVLYLDADDVLFVDALATLHDAMAANPGVDAVLAGTLFWMWAPAFAGRPSIAQELGRWLGRHRPPSLLLAMTRNEDVHPANCSSLFRTEALRAVGGFEAAFTGMYEDTVLLAKLLLEREAVVLDACVSAYRMHPASQCHQAQAAGTYDAHGPNRDRNRYLRWLDGHVRRRRPGALALRAAVRMQRLRFDFPFLLRVLRRLRRLGRRRTGSPPSTVGLPILPGGAVAGSSPSPTERALSALARAQDAAAAA